MNYHVEWHINISADTPQEAAQKALDIQRNPKSWATVFDIINEHGEVTEIDLMADPED